MSRNRQRSARSAVLCGKACASAHSSLLVVICSLRGAEAGQRCGHHHDRKRCPTQPVKNKERSAGADVSVTVICLPRRSYQQQSVCLETHSSGRKARENSLVAGGSAQPGPGTCRGMAKAPPLSCALASREVAARRGVPTRPNMARSIPPRDRVGKPDGSLLLSPLLRPDAPRGPAMKGAAVGAQRRRSREGINQRRRGQPQQVAPASCMSRLLHVFRYCSASDVPSAFRRLDFIHSFFLRRRCFFVASSVCRAAVPPPDRLRRSVRRIDDDNQRPAATSP